MSSFEDKYHEIWNLHIDILERHGGPSGLYQARLENRISEEVYNDVWYVDDYLGRFLEKWREGRMSMSELLRWTPEKVDEHMKSLIREFKQHLALVDTE